VGPDPMHPKYPGKEGDPRWIFEAICVYCKKSEDLKTLSFLLGFYVKQVLDRWWRQFSALAWPDNLAMSLCCFLPGEGRAREMRRGVVRLVSLSTVLALRQVSSKVARRFPTDQHLLEAGLITETEMKKLSQLYEETEGKHWVIWAPIKWAKGLLHLAWKEKLVVDNKDRFWGELTKECAHVYKSNLQLVLYGWVPIPLLYTQVVTIAVYAFFLANLFGSQFLNMEKIDLNNGTSTDAGTTPKKLYNSAETLGYKGGADMYFPFFTILEFIFYMGWLKVAEALINPFGEDDDDFDVNYLIDRHLQVSFMMVEDQHLELEPCPVQVRLKGTKDEAPVMPTDHVIDESQATFSSRATVRRRTRKAEMAAEAEGHHGIEDVTHKLKRALTKKVVKSGSHLLVPGEAELGSHLTVPGETGGFTNQAFRNDVPSLSVLSEESEEPGTPLQEEVFFAELTEEESNDRPSRKKSGSAASSRF